MYREIIFLGISFLVCWRGVYPFLDIDELKNIHYDIDIVDKPVLFGRDLKTDVIYMTSKFGQQYECQMPDITEIELEMEEEKSASEIGISELLKPMESAPCLKKTKDWWSYEFCYGKQIRQYHLDNNKIVGDEIFLGYYESETNWDISNTNSKKNRLNRYHSHIYVNGSKCVLNGSPRQTEVRFLCAEGEGDSIARVDEPSTCTYILTIHTTKICHHPYLKPPPKMKPKSVICAPALSQYQLDTYLYYEEVSKAKQEEEKENQEDTGEKWWESIFAKSASGSQIEVNKEEAGEGASTEEADPTDENEKSLQSILKKYSSAGLEVRGLQAAQSFGISPQKLAKLLEKLLGTVKHSLDEIDEELGETSAADEKIASDETSELETSAGDVASNKEDEDDDDEEDDDDDLSNDDYKKLLKDFREGIPGMDVGSDDEARLEALANELQKSFEYLDSIEKIVDGELTEIENDLTEMDTDDLSDSVSRDLPPVEAETSPVHQDAAKEDVIHEDAAMGGSDDDEKEEEDEEEDESNEADDDEEEEPSEQLQDFDEEEDDKESKPALVSKLNDVIKQLKGDPTTGKASGISTKTPALLGDDDNDHDGRVRVRVTKIRMGKNSNEIQHEKETSLYDTEHRKLEDAIEAHLEQAGVKVEGGKIEVKVLSFSADDWASQSEEDGVTILSEEESTYFKNMVIGLLGNQGVKEEKQHQKLENNYHFHWGSENHRVPDTNDPEE